MSTSSNPLSTWNVWDIRTTNNGQDGTPDHRCSGGYCFGDYPQLGLDANGVYITTNEFAFFGQGEFHGAQLYAFSKEDLIEGDATPDAATISDAFSDAMGDTAYTLQPVNSLPADYVSAHNGTMYFAMSQSPFVDGNATGVSLWRLTNTASLDTTPALQLAETSVETQEYTLGVHALQQARPDAVPEVRQPAPVHRGVRPHPGGPAPARWRQRQDLRRVVAQGGRVPDDEHRAGGAGRRRSTTTTV